jgi:hypothetical protein
MSMDIERAAEMTPRQLLGYSFPPGFSFEGQLLGALQRIESGGALSILAALFVGRDADSGELVAVSLSGTSAGGMIGQLIGFRLDESTRKTQTEETLAGPAGEVVRELASSLEPGAAVAGVLVEHAWAGVLAEAVARLGGSQLTNELLETGASEEPWVRLLRARVGRADSAA